MLNQYQVVEKNQDASGNSPNANKEKKKKGDTSICPICTEIIVEKTKTKKGHNAEGLCKAWLHR